MFLPPFSAMYFAIASRLQPLKPLLTLSPLPLTLTMQLATFQVREALVLSLLPEDGAETLPVVFCSSPPVFTVTSLLEPLPLTVTEPVKSPVHW